MHALAVRIRAGRRTSKLLAVPLSDAGQELAESHPGELGRLGPRPCLTRFVSSISVTSTVIEPTATEQTGRGVALIFTRRLSLAGLLSARPFRLRPVATAGRKFRRPDEHSRVAVTTAPFPNDTLSVMDVHQISRRGGKLDVKRPYIATKPEMPRAERARVVKAILNLFPMPSLMHPPAEPPRPPQAQGCGRGTSLCPGCE